MKEYKINIVCLIMTNIFGCYDDFSINSRIVPSMISNIKNHINENTDMIISFNKNILVNLVFVEDISRIIELCILSENVQGNILIFNKEGTITLENLTIEISKILNYQNKIKFMNDIPIHNNIMKPNLSKFYTLFENFQFTDFKTSLQTTIDFINLTKSE
jgi:nucleoside-diphosphate-sugar epimerase